MKKLKLVLDSLEVESFQTHRVTSLGRTVRGNEVLDTLDAQECAQSLCSACDGTIAAMTCQPWYGTGYCCGISAARTQVCCQGTANCPPG